MKQNNWLNPNTSVSVYEVGSDGIRHIRTTMPGAKPDATPKPAEGGKGAQPMEQNNWLKSNTPVTVYEVGCKGIRHIRTTKPGEEPNDDSERES